jgi:hypothetical protein
MLAMRRTQDLVKAYRGEQPATKDLQRDIEAGLTAFMGRDERKMLRITERMAANLPPMKSRHNAIGAATGSERNENE